MIPKKNNMVIRGMIIKSYGNLLRGEMGIETEETHSWAIEKEIKKKTANCVFFCLYTPMINLDTKKMLWVFSGRLWITGEDIQ